MSRPIQVRDRVTRIEPTRGMKSLGLTEMWQFRDLLWFHTAKEVRGKYRQMALGPLWIVLRPIVNTILFVFVFSTLAQLPSEGIPYPLFTFVGLLPWLFFQSACGSASGSLVQQMPVISKVYFPRMIIPFAATIAWLVDFVVSFVVLVVLMLAYGYVPGWRVVFLPGFLLLAMAFALALGLCTASLAVKYRDVSIFVGYGLRGFLYLTPVAYSATLVPEPWLWAYQLNPMYWVVTGFRWALVDAGPAPSLAMVAPTLATLLLLLAGIFMFRRTERTVVDLL